MQDQVLDALGNPSRRLILAIVREKPHSAGAIAEEFKESFSAISQHLKILRNAHLIKETKVGRERIYTINPEGFIALTNWLAMYEQFWSDRLGQIDRALKRRRSLK